MTHAPLTILQVTYQGDGAGSTQSIFNLSQHLAARGHRVLVGCRAESLLARLAVGGGLEVVPLDFRRLGALATRLADVVARRRGRRGVRLPICGPSAAARRWLLGR